MNSSVHTPLAVATTKPIIMPIGMTFCATILLVKSIAQNVIPIGIIMGFVVATASGVFTLLFTEF